MEPKALLWWGNGPPGNIGWCASACGHTPALGLQHTTFSPKTQTRRSLKTDCAPAGQRWSSDDKKNSLHSSEIISYQINRYPPTHNLRFILINEGIKIKKPQRTKVRFKFSVSRLGLTFKTYIKGWIKSAQVQTRWRAACDTARLPSFSNRFSILSYSGCTSNLYFCKCFGSVPLCFSFASRCDLCETFGFHHHSQLKHLEIFSWF